MEAQLDYPNVLVGKQYHFKERIGAVGYLEILFASNFIKFVKD
jgi:hypothetical protein